MSSEAEYTDPTNPANSEPDSPRPFPAIGQIVRHKISRNIYGEVIEIRSDRTLKPIVAVTGDGAEFFMHHDQWEPYVDPRWQVAQPTLGEVMAQLDEPSDWTKEAVVEAAGNDDEEEALWKFQEALARTLKAAVEHAFGEFLARRGVEIPDDEEA